MTVAKFINTPFDGVLSRPVTLGNTLHLNVRGRMLTIYMTSKSGKIIYRNKIDTIIGIVHPGIILGADQFGVVWVIHNHYKIGHPEIVTLEEFAESVIVYEDTREVFYSTSEVIQRAIECWNARKQYSWLFHNCQHFVNKIVMNRAHSEALDKISNGGLVIGGIVSLYGIVTGDKAIVTVGLTIGGAGLGVKAINK